jgi:3-oxoacyl-[acyl-carrier protein] reductase
MNIVITGASRGIGFDTAIKLAEDKTNTVIALSRNKEGLHKLKEMSIQNNQHIDTHVVDLKDFEEGALSQLFSTYGQVDILINNAGLLINKSFMDLSMAEWKDVFETNFFGSIKLIRCLLPFISKSPIAHIVNIGSMGGYQGSGKFPGLSAYSASKAALANLTECLAEEFRPLKIRVNCLALGSVNTEMLESAFPGFVAPVNSEDMAAFLADFSLNFYKFFNGKILPVSVSVP